MGLPQERRSRPDDRATGTSSPRSTRPGRTWTPFGAGSVRSLATDAGPPDQRAEPKVVATSRQAAHPARLRRRAGGGARPDDCGRSIRLGHGRVGSLPAWMDLRRIDAEAGGRGSRPPPGRVGRSSRRLARGGDQPVARLLPMACGSRPTTGDRLHERRAGGVPRPERRRSVRLCSPRRPGRPAYVACFRWVGVICRHDRSKVTMRDVACGRRHQSTVSRVLSPAQRHPSAPRPASGHGAVANRTHRTVRQPARQSRGDRDPIADIKPLLSPPGPAVQDVAFGITTT